MIFPRKILILLPLVILIACKPDDQKPRLVILIAVDQLAHHTYNHYKPIFKDGYKWLADHGVSFDKTYHEHGYSGTGPGHFVLGSGLHPGPAGLIGNSWYDRESGKNIYCVEDSNAHALDIPAYSVSYDQVNGSSFGDWLKAASPESKVYSVACKDRAAILMGGKNPDAAIWYNWRGSFTSNDYYFDQIPQWLHNFNSKANMLSYRDSIWTKSANEKLYTEYAHPDSFSGEKDRYLKEPYSPVFPIGFEVEWKDKKIFGEMGGRPWMDRITLELATEVIEVGDLGQDTTPDVLTIGLTAMDIVGHHYGPYSHEAMDLLIKQDQYLGEFFRSLDQQVGLEHVLISMSSDHGIMPLPEHWIEVMGRRGGRINSDEYEAGRNNAFSALDSLYGGHEFLKAKGSRYYYNYEMMDSLAIDQTQLDSIMQTNIERVEGIHRLYGRDELLASDSVDPRIVRLKRFMHPEQSPDLHTLLDEGWLFDRPYGTNHSTPYGYDSRVPLIFSHVSLKGETRYDSVATVDIATTLGDILGVLPTNKIDGLSLKELIFQTK